MFLTKKAEEEFFNLIKQAKKAVAGSSEDKKEKDDEIEEEDVIAEEAAPAAGTGNPAFDSLIECINNNQANDAQAVYADLADADRSQFLRLVFDSINMKKPLVDETAWNYFAEQQLMEAKPKAPKEEKPKEDKALEDNAMPGLGDGFDLAETPKEDAPLKEDEAGDKELDAILDEEAGGDDFSTEASMFEFFSKKASKEEKDKEETKASITKEDEGKICNVIKAAVSYGKENGMDDAKCAELAKADLGAEGSEYDEAINKVIASYKSANKPATLEEKTAAATAFLKQIHDYTPEPNKFERILQVAKASANSEEFLQKIAVELDEKPNVKQYAGEKMFDGDFTTYGGGNTPKFPGQKVFMSRDGGNAPVETIFDKAITPEIDVYKDKKNRKKVTKIDTPSGTIAFMQPIQLEQEDITMYADENGVIGGEIQMTKPGIGEPKATAAHTTQNYLDTLVDVAPKSPKKLAGEIPEAKASVKETLTKEAAGFVFHAGLKKKSNEMIDIPTNNVGGNIANDSFGESGDNYKVDVEVNVNPEEKEKRRKEELMKAYNAIKEREANIECCSGFNFTMQKEAADDSLFTTVTSLLNNLQSSFPAAYRSVEAAANSGDTNAFGETLKRAITTNLRNGNSNVDDLANKIALDTELLTNIKKDYFGIEPVVPEQPEGGKKEESGEGKEGKDDADALAEELGL